MVDYSKLRQVYNPQQTMQQEPVMPNVSSTSAINPMQRMKLASVNDPERKYKMLLSMGYSDRQIIRPAASPTKDWAITDDSGTVFPVDPKGYSSTDIGGDIAESVPSILKGIGSAAGGALGAAGGAAAGTAVAPGPGTVGGAIAGGSAGGAAGASATDALLQKFLSGNVSKKQVAQEGIMGGVSSLLPGSSNLASAAIGKQTFGKAAEKMAMAQLGKKVAVSLAGANPKLINIVDPIKGELGERTLKDVVGNKYVNAHTQSLMTTEADTIAGRAADKVKNFFEKEMPKVTNKFYSSVPNERPVNVGEAIYNMDNLVTAFKENATKAQQKGIGKLEKIVGEMTDDVSESGAVNFGKLKAHIADLYETSGKLRKSGNNTLASQYEQAAQALRAARDSVPEIQKATQKFKAVKQVEDFFTDFMRMDSARGEVNMQQKIQALSKNDGARQRIHEMWKIMHKYKETRPYADMMDEIKLAQVATDIKNAKAVKPGGNWINRVPFLKEAANLNPLTSPEESMKLMAAQSRAGLIKPTALERQVERSNLPFIGGAITKARSQAAMYGKGKGIAPTPTGISAGVLDKVSKLIGRSIPQNITMPQLRKLLESLSQQKSDENYYKEQR